MSEDIMELGAALQWWWWKDAWSSPTRETLVRAECAGWCRLVDGIHQRKVGTGEIAGFNCRLQLQASIVDIKMISIAVID